MIGTDDQLPKVLGGFEILSKLGQGGMGAVFKARQPGLDRIVALKVLPPEIAKNREFIERFQREARASAKLNHPHIVQGIDVGQDEATGLWYFAMEFVDGPSLKNVLDQEGTIPEKRALEWVRDIARALECAERNGIVHRDIKPDNILLDEHGQAKLADLGLAKQSQDDASLTQTGMAVGTPFYMAPEQAQGLTAQIDIRTDLYALGATLFHLVTGQPLFTGATGAVIMAKHLTEKPPLAHRVAPQVSEACSRLIARLVQKQMNQRLHSPAELLDQIERLLSQNATTGPRQPIALDSGSRMPVQRGGTSARLAPIRGLTTGPRAAVGGSSGTPAAGNWAGMGMGVGAIVALAGLLFFSSGSADSKLKSGPATALRTEPQTPQRPAVPPVATPEKRPLSGPAAALPAATITANPPPPGNTTVLGTRPAMGTLLPESLLPPPAEPAPYGDAEAKRLRERLLPMGRSAPREQVKLLGDLPQPAEAESLLYRLSITAGNLDGWVQDWDSKVSVAMEAGEMCLVVRKGTRDRAACLHSFHLPINHTRIRMRVYTSGVQLLKLSVLGRLGPRFSIPVPVPLEHQWTDVEVEISSAEVDGIKAANQPIQHLEIHGIQKLNLPAEPPSFLLSKFEWLNGGGAPVPAAQKGAAGLKPDSIPGSSAKPEGGPLSQTAYAAFADEFLGLLLAGETKNAVQRLAQAEKDSNLLRFKAELAQDRVAMGWLDDVERATLKGAERLKDIERFTLHLKQGEAMTVGKLAPFKLSAVKDGILHVGSKGMDLPISVEKLHAQTRRQLAELELGGDAASLLRRAWVSLLSMGGGADAPSPATVRAAIEKARATGAAEADVAYLRGRLETLERKARESAAAAAWEGVLNLDREKQWNPLLVALLAFQAGHGTTSYAQAKAAEAAVLHAKAEKAIDLAEGMNFIRNNVVGALAQRP